MSATAGYFGLRPANHPSGVIRPNSLGMTKALIEATPTLRLNQPCAFHADGRLTTVGANNVDMIGVFQGVFYTDLASGRPVVANQWVNGTLVKDMGAESATLYFTQDPTITYEIQANAALTAAVIGDQIGFGNFTTGNATTGISEVYADQATLAGAGNQSMLRIISVAPYVDNLLTDAFPIIQVQIARHQFVSNKVAV